ncbi:g2273 [Coccomyxa elongata]
MTLSFAHQIETGAKVAATIRGTFSYKNPKVHDVELRPGMTARLEGVDGEISRVHFIDPNTNAPKPPPTTAVFKNLTSNTTQVHSWDELFED